jgi:hypothetical protein
MTARRRRASSFRTAARWIARGAGLAVGAYAGYAAVTWSRYGHPRPAKPEEADPLLDQFMPHYEVVERHDVQVDAPADVTFAVACEMNLFDLPLARAIFRGRELILGATPARPYSRGLVDEMQAIGWRRLAEVPGREVVMGAVTKPWEANPTFRGLPPEVFATFDEPDYVKIAWTLRADADGTDRSVFRTETRAVATDPAARARFRRYWAWLSPGIILIRWASLRPLKRAAERQAHRS